MYSPYGEKKATMNQLKALKRIEPRILVPLTLGIMFALGDESSNPKGYIMQGRESLIVKIVVFCVLFCALFRTMDILIHRIYAAKDRSCERHCSGFFEYGYCFLVYIGRTLRNNFLFITGQNDSLTTTPSP